MNEINLQDIVNTANIAENAVYEAQIAALQAIIESLAPDVAPDPFPFAPVTGAPLSQQTTSDEITVAGINQAVVVTSTVPRSKNGGAYTTLDGVAVAGDTFRLRLTSSAVASTAVSGTLTIGSATSDFSVTTGDFITPMSMFPEQLHRVWLQEDVAEGPVASWPSRGRITTPATQANAANRPTKLPDNGGIAFAQGAVQWLQWAFDGDTPYSHRWWIVIAKADLAAAANPAILAVHGVSGSNTTRQPYVAFDVTNDTMSSSVNDSAIRTQTGAAVSNEWNVLLGFRRGQKYGAVVNGVRNADQDFLGFRVNNVSAISTMGHSITAVSPANTAIDCIMFGDGELTDRQIDILVGWAHWRVGSQGTLPTGHPFKNAPPASSDVSAADFHDTYVYDPTAQAAWKIAADAIRQSRMGEPTFDATGYKPVFFADFDRADQFPVSDLGGNKNAPFFAPYWLTSRGGQAQLVSSSGQPFWECYAQDTAADAAGAGRPGVMSLKLINPAGTQWRVGAMCLVNNNGAGRRFGPGLYEARIRFKGNETEPFVGLFPGVWSYGIDHLTNRARPRIELDWYEGTGDGGNDAYHDANFHAHQGQYLKDTPGKPPAGSSGPNHYRTGGELINPANGFPFTQRMYDGQWHDLKARVIPGGLVQVWNEDHELFRVPSNDAWEVMQYFIFDMALSAAHGDRTPAVTEVFSFDIDYFRVSYTEAFLATVPAGFSALPTIAEAGGVYTVTPNTAGSHIEYRWYRDAVPIVPAVTGSYTKTAEDVGHKLRCHVKNVALVNQSEAWTAETATVT